MTDYLEEKGAKISVSDKASPWQNGYQESFYSGFKLDLGPTSHIKELGELFEVIAKTMNYYNNSRIHTSLKMSPVAFR